MRAVTTAMLLIGYLLHAIGQDEFSLFIAWATVLLKAVWLVAASFSTFGFGGRGAGLAVLVVAQQLLLGTWISVHFEWLSADVAAFCERLLFNILPLPSAAITTWAAGALLGAEVTPAALLALLGSAYGLLGTERPASLVGTDDMPRATRPRSHPTPPPTAADDMARLCLAASVVACPVVSIPDRSASVYAVRVACECAFA